MARTFGDFQLKVSEQVHTENEDFQTENLSKNPHTY